MAAGSRRAGGGLAAGLRRTRGPQGSCEPATGSREPAAGSQEIRASLPTGSRRPCGSSRRACANPGRACRRLAASSRRVRRIRASSQRARGSSRCARASRGLVRDSRLARGGFVAGSRELGASTRYVAGTRSSQRIRSWRAAGSQRSRWDSRRVHGELAAWRRAHDGFAAGPRRGRPEIARWCPRP